MRSSRTRRINRCCGAPGSSITSALRRLAERFPETVETQPELLAHYTREGQHSRRWSTGSGRGNAPVSARPMEAISHLRKGLAVLQMLPDTPARLQHELELQTTLGPAWIATKGFGAPEVAQAYTRARELCQQMGETPDVFPVLRGLWVFHEARAELQVARELAEQLLVLAQRLQDPVSYRGHRALGNTLFWLGEFAPARVYLEQAIALYDVQQHRSGIPVWDGSGGRLPLLCGPGAVAAWLSGPGPPEKRRGAHAGPGAVALPEPGRCLALGVLFHQSCREVLLVQERAEALMGLAAEQGFQLAGRNYFRDCALVEQGRQGRRDGPAAPGWPPTGPQGGPQERTYWLALLAEAWDSWTGREGLRLLREALVVEESGERLWEAELYRLRANCCCTRPFRMHSTLKHVFTRPSRPAASRQSLELRAAMSLVSGSVGKRGSCRMLARSAAGSARGLIPPTCGRPRRVRRTDVKSYYRRFSKAVALIRRRGTDRMRGKIGTKVE